jgi:hypothetical protein
MTCYGLNNRYMNLLVSIYFREARLKSRFVISLIQSTLNPPVSPVSVMPNYSMWCALLDHASRRSILRAPPRPFANSMHERTCSSKMRTPSMTSPRQ